MLESSDHRILLLGGFGRVAKAFIFLALSEQRSPRIDIFDMVQSDPPLPPPVARIPQRSVPELDPSLFSQYDVVVNLLPVSLSEDILDIAANSTCATYVDLSSDGDDQPEQVEYSDKFAAEGRLLLSNVGIAPGLDNMLVADLVDRGASWVKIFLIEHSTDEVYIPSWCEEDASISSNDHPISFDGHKLNRHELFDAPQHLETSAGSFQFYRFFGEEVLSLAHNYPKLQIDLKAGGHEVEVARALVNGDKVRVASAADNPEPEGVFGIKVISDVGTAEVIMKSTTHLRAEGLPGNHISFHTGAMLYYSLNHTLSHPSETTGTVFSENLPAKIRSRILEEVRGKLASTFAFSYVAEYECVDTM